MLAACILGGCGSSDRAALSAAQTEGESGGAPAGQEGAGLPFPGGSDGLSGLGGSGRGGGGDSVCQEFCSLPDAGTAGEPSAGGANVVFGAGSGEPSSGSAGSDTAPPRDAGMDSGAGEVTSADCSPPLALFELQDDEEGRSSGCPPKHCTTPLLDQSNREIWDWPNGVSDLSPLVGCTTVEGDIAVANHPRTDVTELSCLERVTGSLVIWNSDRLLSLDGLSSLRVVEGDLDLGFHQQLSVGLAGLQRMDALHKLEVVGGSLRISNLPVRSLHGLETLRVVGGNVFISFSPLTDLAGLSGLRAVGGGFSLWRPEGQTGTAGADALVRVGGGFYLWSATDLAALSGFPKLACVGGVFDVGDLVDARRGLVLERIAGFGALSYVGDIAIEGNAGLREVSLFDHGLTVGTDVRLSRNPLLERAPGLENTQVAGGVWIEDNTNLPACPAEALRARATTGSVANNRPCAAGQSCLGPVCAAP